MIVPAFAVGRAQEMIYRIRLLEDAGEIPSIPVLLDSPMSKEATEIYLDHSEEFPQNASVAQSPKNFFPRRFEVIKSNVQSAETLRRHGPMIVISASGMLQGGRVLHHLKSRITSERNTVLFVGYQAEGTKGRYLQNLPKDIRIHHELLPVQARIATLHGLSGHADQNELLAWVKSSPHPPHQILINHGNLSAMTALKARIESELKIPCQVIDRAKTVKI
jgi:metallo-beta-lactamase family protein